MKTTSGMTLIEILISMFLISILLLGIDAMQIISLTQAKVNYQFVIAQQQMSNMIEHIKLSQGEIAYSIWNKQNQEVLPNGQGIINNNEISIFWGDNHALQCENNTVKSSGCLRIQL